RCSRPPITPVAGKSLRSRKMTPHRVTLVTLRALGPLFLLLFASLLAAGPALADDLLIRPARVFDGVNPAPHEGWSVLVDGDKIAAVGPNLAAPAGAR